MLTSLRKIITSKRKEWKSIKNYESIRSIQDSRVQDEVFALQNRIR